MISQWGKDSSKASPGAHGDGWCEVCGVEWIFHLEPLVPGSKDSQSAMNKTEDKSPMGDSIKN